MHINLAEKNPSRLLNSLQSAFEDEPDEITIELIGPGVLYHDTALMLHEEMKSHAGVTRVHVRARTCLIDGAVLLWLAADTRSMRDDTWIQVNDVPYDLDFTVNKNYPHAICTSDEGPSKTDFRTILKYINQYLPVNEIAGFRLFAPDIQEFGLLEDCEDSLTPYFFPDTEEPLPPTPQDRHIRNSNSKI